MKPKLIAIVSALLLSPLVVIENARAQGTAFTYQGRLTSGTNEANSIYDLHFRLFDALSSGMQIGPSRTNMALAVSNGFFTVTLDFTNGAFPGADRWLDIGVRSNGVAAFSPLTPRQKITPTPYALYAAGVSATGINGTIAAASISGLYTNNVTFTNAGNTFSGSGAGLNNVNAATLGGLSSSSFWRTTGNVGTTAGTHFVGTSDDQPLELRVNTVRAVRLEPGTNKTLNVIAGSPLNGVADGVIGATLSGGGASASNNISAYDFPGLGGTSSGSAGVHSNNIGASYATISGGRRNLIGSNAFQSVIGGGAYNTIADHAQSSVIAGGSRNSILNPAGASVIGGGIRNEIGSTNIASTISGGYENVISPRASRSTIGGGMDNTIAANAEYATIPGGQDNAAGGDHSFAAGHRAKANHQGAFVWADSTAADFPSTATNQFLVRASGGVGINVTNPVDALHVQSASSVRSRTTTTGAGFAGFVSENSLGDWFAGVASGTNHWYLFENAPQPAHGSSSNPAAMSVSAPRRQTTSCTWRAAYRRPPL